MTKTIDEFNDYRKRMNERILGSDHLGIERMDEALAAPPAE